METIESNSQTPTLINNWFDFIGISFLTGLSSAIVLATIVLLLASVSS